MMTGKNSWRLRFAWKLLVLGYLGLSMVSVAILARRPDLSTVTGRHLLAGALANLGLVFMGIVVTATAYRRGERWAWVASLAALYGLPILFIDAYYFGFGSRTVLPQIIGGAVGISALLLPVDIFWQGDRSP